MTRLVVAALPAIGGGVLLLWAAKNGWEMNQALQALIILVAALLALTGGIVALAHRTRLAGLLLAGGLLIIVIGTSIVGTSNSVRIGAASSTIPLFMALMAAIVLLVALAIFEHILIRFLGAFFLGALITLAPSFLAQDSSISFYLFFGVFIVPAIHCLQPDLISLRGLLKGWLKGRLRQNMGKQ
jgi:hypothetical protein